jgi:hypothetical protein
MHIRSTIAGLAAATLIAAGVTAIAASSAQAAPSTAHGNTPAAQIEKATGSNGVIATSQAGSPADAFSYHNSNGNSVTVPKKASQGVTLASSPGQTLTMGVANANGASEAATDPTGTTTYANPGKHTVSAIQVTTTGITEAVLLQDPTAGNSVSYPLSLPAGTSLASDGAGGYNLVQQGQGIEVVVGNIAAPWAKDAGGKPLPSSYTLTGNTLTQTVNTNGASYPITIDPKVSSTWWNTTVFFNKSETSMMANWYIGAGTLAGSLVKRSIAGVSAGVINGISLAGAILSVDAAFFQSFHNCLKIVFYANQFEFPSVQNYSGGYCS